MSAVATFDVCAGFEVTQGIDRRAVQTPDGSPVVRGRAVNERSLRTWELVWNKDTRAAIVRIKQLYALAKGQVLNLTWTPPGGSPLEVRFARPIAYTLESGVATSISVLLEEAF